MTQSDTLALVRRYYDAFNRGDVKAMADCLSDDVVHDVNQGGRRMGKQAFLEKRQPDFRKYPWLP